MNIVSFYAPRQEHRFFQDYTPFLDLLRASCERYGHRHVVLTDDPAVGDDAYVVDLPRSLMRAFVAAQYAYLSDPANAHTPTLLTGADCVLASDPAAVFDGTFDLGITVGNFSDCRMNTGAVFIPEPCRVAEIWAEALRHVGDDWGDDQRSLYQAILQRSVHVRLKEFPADPYNLAPSWPGDDCSRAVVLHFRGKRKRWMLDYCHKWLGLGEGVTLKTAPNTSDDDMLANVAVNVVRDLPCVDETPEHDGHAVMVGGGPSLASTLDEIKQRQALGQTIFAMNGAARWLSEHGVVADFTVILDPRAKNAEFIGWSERYLLASQCAPAVFERAADLPVQMWHFGMPGVENVAREGCLISGSITVGLTALCLVYTMGYRNLHLYGYDSSDADGQAHAYDQDETRPEAMRIEAWCAGRSFLCGPAMYAQAAQFENIANVLAEAGAVLTVHGDGLLPTIARQMCAAAPVEKELVE